MVQANFGIEFGNLVPSLAIAAARTIALASVAGVLLSVLRVKPTSARLFTWTAVMYAGVSMPLLVWLFPPLPVVVPFLQSSSPHRWIAVEKTFVSTTPAPIHDDSESGAKIDATAGKFRRFDNEHPARQKALPFWQSVVPLRTFATVIYMVGVLFLLSRLLIGLTYAYRLVRSSSVIHDPRVNERLSRIAGSLSLRALPPIHESRHISVPVTVGAVAPTILLPCAWNKWDDAKLNSVIIHEMSHVARYDHISQRLSLIHRATFWFSPLSWWLHRHIVELAEQASDEAALASGAERTHYAETLLGFFEIVGAGSHRIRWQGVSMASRGQAEKRLERILAWRGDKRMFSKKSALIMILFVAIPAVYIVAAAHTVNAAQPSDKGMEGYEQVSGSGSTSNAAPPSSSAHVEPAQPQSQAQHSSEQDRSSRSGHHVRYSYGNGFDDEQRFVIVTGKSGALTMSGSSEDARHAEKLKQRIPGDFIWFERDEKSYIIRDQATVERARQLWAPQEELGRKQEELGKQQEALGKKQAELGTRMQSVRVKVPDLTNELDKLKAELQQLGPDATVDQVGKIQSEIGRLQSRIGEIQSHAGDEQGKLGEEMGALGEQQGKLGQQQGELGRQQGELAEKATREMKQLLDDAIKKGVAQPETEEPSGTSL